MPSNEPITVRAFAQVPCPLAWEVWTLPEHITQWNFASPDWHCPEATNDLRPGGRLCSTMAPRSGGEGFQFEAIYESVNEPAEMVFVLTDGRRVSVRFIEHGDAGTEIIETFDPEDTFDRELQRQGWQAILDNFARYAASLAAG